MQYGEPKMRITETIRTKLAENMTNSKDFWRENLKIDPVLKSFCNTHHLESINVQVHVSNMYLIMHILSWEIK